MPVSWVMKGGNGFAGVDQRGPLVLHAVPVKAHSGNFQDGILGGSSPVVSISMATIWGMARL